MSLPEKATSCFINTVPHFVTDRERYDCRGGRDSLGNFLYCHEGRTYAALAWLYKRIDPADKRAEEHYTKEVEIFQKVG
jgi:hypothetical protein